ncbi:MAG: hypothetical protein VKM97_06765 [Cyanobacteriota bacterium]|nr:hypothetical protein [Cyanobacteriota bacterium]
MDLPPLQLEMLRWNLQGQAAVPLCRPANTAVQASLTGIWGAAEPCRPAEQRLRIDEPAGWPVLPPPPVPTLP